MNNFSDELKAQTDALAISATRLHHDACALLVGRRVKFVKDWRDQAVGHSRPNWKGREAIVMGVSLDSNWGSSVFVDGARYAVRLDVVEFIK